MAIQTRFPRKLTGDIQVTLNAQQLWFPLLRLIFLLALTLTLSLLGIGCRPTPLPHRERTSTNELLLIGLDGESWNVLIPAMRMGGCPATQRLIIQGIHSNLASIHPMKSPRIWTSMVTGKVPEKHGIVDFVQFVSTDTGQEKRLMTSNVRKVKALWEILSEQGISNCFIAWWASWPAEKTRGMIASSHVWPFMHKFYMPTETDYLGEVISHRTYPEKLIEAIQSYNYDPGAIEEAVRTRLLLTEDDWFYARDISYFQQAQYLAERFAPQVCGVYLQGIDACSHPYWLNQQKISAYYHATDSEVAKLLENARSELSVIICSDHGFKGVEEGVKLPGGKPGRISTLLQATPGDHYQYGVFIAAGPIIRRSLKIVRSSVLDLTPTILALLGLPIAEDMDGSIMTDLFEPGARRLPEPSSITTYETEERASGTALETELDEAIMESLKRLGYAL